MPQNAAVNHSEPHIGVLMAVYEGAKTLPAQLESLREQNHRNWSLLVSDDSVSKESKSCLTAFEGPQKVTVLEGPRAGAAANFMSLVARSGPLLPADSWLAYCDQDDVWLPERLAWGRQALQEIPANVPALYCSRTWVVDHKLEHRRLSVGRPRPPGFLNALAQNIAAGNTILVNAAGTQLLQEVAKTCGPVVMHDWWSYQVISGAGGRIIHDDRPTLLYRQHDANEVGANTGWRAKVSRLRRMLKGEFRDWNDTNIAALQNTRRNLTPEAQTQLDEFAALRSRSAVSRVRAVRRLGVYRQSSASTVALWVAAALGKL